jgi:hypothetical protein
MKDVTVTVLGIRLVLVARPKMGKRKREKFSRLKERGQETR